MSSDPLNATVVQRHDLNEIHSIVRVRTDDGEIPAFLPGQYMTLGLPREVQPGAETPATARRLIRRPYSIASADNADQLEFFVIKIRRGRLTEKLWTLGEGDRLWVDRRVYGDMTLEVVPPDADVITISTGTGISPFVSMLRSLRGRGRWRRFAIVNGVRRMSDLGFRGEIEQMAREDDSVRYVPLVSREEDAPWEGLRGRVQRLVAEDYFEHALDMPLDPERCHVFLCGNPEMIREMEALLTPRGFTHHARKTPGNLHFERYW